MKELKEKKFISLIMYIHNSQEQLKEFLPYIVSVLDNNFEKFEIIAVNDKSSDQSIHVIKDFLNTRKVNGIITIVNMSSYQGIEASMNAGMDLAIGDFIFEFDKLELDYDENMLMEVYRKELEGYDIVSAAPKTTKGVAAKLFYSIFNWGSRDMKKLSQETFRILSRRAINRVKTLNKSVPYRKALYINSGMSSYTIFYDNVVIKRDYDKQEISNRLDMAFDSLVLFTDTVQKVSLIISTVFLAFAILVGIYTVVIYCSSNKPVEGWAPIMGFLSFGFSGVFILITVIIKHLSIMLKMLYKKQGYLVESIEKIS